MPDQVELEGSVIVTFVACTNYIVGVQWKTPTWTGHLEAEWLFRLNRNLLRLGRQQAAVAPPHIGKIRVGSSAA